MAEVSIPSNTPEQYKPGWQGSTGKKIAGQMQENIPGEQHSMLDTPLDDVLANGEKYKGSGKLKVSLFSETASAISFTDSLQRERMQ